MPEGDSYTRAAHRFRPVLSGQAITGVAGSAPAIRKRSREILGTTVGSVRTLGKHLMLDLDSGLTVHIHLGMPGTFRVTAPGQPGPRDQGAVRMALATGAGTAWILAAPTVEVERTQAIDQSLTNLGPDLLGEDFDWEQFARKSNPYPGDRTVSDFLLDQRVMAGIGNVYKCEVLFLEGIRPDRPMETITDETRTSLARRARRLMLPNARRAVRSTTGRPDGGTWVYDRTGKPCRRCRHAIEEGWVGDPGRITYWCPLCQT